MKGHGDCIFCNFVLKKNNLNRVAKILLLTFSVFLFITGKAQEIRWDLNPDYIARAATPSFNPFENDLGVVKAAGMELFDEEDNSEIIEDLIDFAFTFKGTRYRRGGKTPAGFDCSGFTRYIFGQFGIELNSDSRSQFLQGDPVDNALEVQPGDLLFFGGRAAGTIIGHVGIAVDVDYSTGKITFIHSSTSGGVKTDTTFDPYYSRRYRGARRIL